MKTIKTRVLVVVFMLGTLVNYANNKEVSNVLNAKKVKVVFEGAKKGQQLTIKDNNGIILHSENVISSGNLIKTFDFSNLKNGNYFLELEKDFEIIIKSIKIKGNNVIFSEDSKKTIFKPLVRSIENKLMVSSIILDEEPLEVTIYYNNTIIYSEIANGDTILNRIYRLDDNKKGDYKVIITKNDRNFINDFKI